MIGLSYADAERICFEATKAMLLSGRRELTPDLLERELEAHAQRLDLAAGKLPIRE
jgi:hypothetical protein